MSPRSLPRRCGAVRERSWNHAHPSLARGWPCRRSSLARLRAPITLRTASMGPGRLRRAAAAGATQRRSLRSPLTSLACSPGSPAPPRPSTARRARQPLPRRAQRRAALRASARIRHPSRRGVRSAIVAFLRAMSPRPHLANARPRHVRLRLTPPPRSRRRAKPSRSNLAVPCRRGSGASSPPPCRSRHHSPPTSPAARLRREMARDARARMEQGRSPARPRNSPASGGTCCALRLLAEARR